MLCLIHTQLLPNRQGTDCMSSMRLRTPQLWQALARLTPQLRDAHHSCSRRACAQSQCLQGGLRGTDLMKQKHRWPLSRVKEIKRPRGAEQAKAHITPTPSPLTHLSQQQKNNCRSALIHTLHPPSATPSLTFCAHWHIHPRGVTLDQRHLSNLIMTQTHLPILTLADLVLQAQHQDAPGRAIRQQESSPMPAVLLQQQAQQQQSQQQQPQHADLTGEDVHMMGTTPTRSSAIDRLAALTAKRTSTAQVSLRP